MTAGHFLTRRVWFGIFVVAAACMAVAGCGQKTDEVSVEDIERAKAVVVSFKKDLQAALREGLREGPAEAISVCQIKAPRISESLSGDGVEVGRTSHRLRNPGNAPEPWMGPLLETYIESEVKADGRAIRLADGSVGYVEPIYVEPLCLTCHGSDLSPTVAARIDSLYPDDEAVGFEPGDFRGLFWVRLDADRADT